MQKQIFVESVGATVLLSRRRGTRSLRLSIRSDGRIRLTVPYGVTEAMALRFLEQKSDWIAKHQKPTYILRDGVHIGKAHRLVIKNEAKARISTRISGNEVRITLPLDTSENDVEAQSVILKTSEKALKIEGERLLPQRLQDLSEKFQLPFNSIKVKKLKSRWGSCDTHKNIVLNIYLMQLEWKLIDYVILHELSHTVHRHHQPEFWELMSQLLPDFKERRRELKTFPTNVIATKF